MADTKISELEEIIQPASNSVFPVVDSGMSKKVTYANLTNNLPIATFVQNNSAFWGGTLPSARFEINANVGLFNSLNSTEYIVPWNDVVYQTNSSIIEADNVTNNMIIKQTGTYLINTQYAAYDLTDLNVDSLRTRLRGQANTPITTTSGGTLLYTLDDGFLKVGGDPINDNGRAASRGTFLIRITTVPYYLVVTFLHTGGSASGGTAYPVFENSKGTIPFFTVHKLS